MSVHNNRPGVCDDVCECATLQVFHDHPQLVSHQETVVHVHDVWVMVVAHYYHLQQWQKILHNLKNVQQYELADLCSSYPF